MGDINIALREIIETEVNTMETHCVARVERINQAISQIKALYKPLLDALQDLYDEQNGPPLIRDKDSWEKAMEKAKQAIINARGEE